MRVSVPRSSLALSTTLLLAACGGLSALGTGSTTDGGPTVAQEDAGAYDASFSGGSSSGGSSSGSSSSGSGSSSGASSSGGGSSSSSSSGGGSSSGSSSSGVQDATVGQDGASEADAASDGSVASDGAFPSEDAQGSPDSAAPGDASIPDGSFGAPVAVIQHVLVPPVLLASNGTDLFWIDGKGLLWTAPTGGGTPTNLSTSSTTELLSVDATNLYFVPSNALGNPSAIDRMPNAGGAASPIVSTSSGIFAATVKGGQAYWLEDNGTFTQSVWTAPLATGTATLLGTPSMFNSNGAIAVTAGTLFLQGGGELFSMPIGGGTATLLINNGIACQTLLAGDNAAYCGASPLVLIAPDGATTQIALETNNVTSMALDVMNVYWVNNAPSGSVVAAPKQGGQNYVVAYDTNPTAVAVDDTAIYWGDIAGNIQRAAKQ
jgi:hypothetical protein